MSSDIASSQACVSHSGASASRRACARFCASLSASNVSTGSSQKTSAILHCHLRTRVEVGLGVAFMLLKTWVRMRRLLRFRRGCCACAMSSARASRRHPSRASTSLVMGRPSCRHDRQGGADAGEDAPGDATAAVQHASYGTPSGMVEGAIESEQVESLGVCAREDMHRVLTASEQVVCQVAHEGGVGDGDDVDDLDPLVGFGIFESDEALRVAVAGGTHEDMFVVRGGAHRVNETRHGSLAPPVRNAFRSAEALI